MKTRIQVCMQFTAEDHALFRENAELRAYWKGVILPVERSAANSGNSGKLRKKLSPQFFVWKPFIPPALLETICPSQFFLETIWQNVANPSFLKMITK